MATSTQLILIIACACVIDCRYMRERLRKPQSSINDRAITAKTTIKYSDAVVFPSDDDTIKKVDAMITDNQDNISNVTKANADSKVKDSAPLISKIVPEVENKEVFTNPILDNTGKANVEVINEKETLIAKLDKSAVLTVTDKVQINDNKVPVIKDVNGSEIKINDAPNVNNTTPDFTNRFGGNGNYILVPVANNAANYQPLQTIGNVVPYSSTQNNAGQITPTNLNANSMTQYGANVAPTIGNNLQYPPNVGSVQYAAPNNANFNPAPQTNTNTYVPVNVPNTYVINGQLYAAITVPSNAAVPNNLYYVNPQLSGSGYQVSNNVPLYNLVSIDNGVRPLSPQTNMNVNSQFVSN